MADYLRVLIHGGHSGSQYCYFSGVFPDIATTISETQQLIQGELFRLFLLEESPAFFVEHYRQGKRVARENLGRNLEVTDANTSVDFEAIALPERYEAAENDGPIGILGINGQAQEQHYGWVGDFFRGHELKQQEGLVSLSEDPDDRIERLVTELLERNNFREIISLCQKEMDANLDNHLAGRAARFTRLLVHRSNAHLEIGERWLSWADTLSAAWAHSGDSPGQGPDQILVERAKAILPAASGIASVDVLLRPFALGVLLAGHERNEYTSLGFGVSAGLAKEMAAQCESLRPELAWLWAYDTLHSVRPEDRAQKLPEVTKGLEAALKEKPLSPHLWNLLGRACSKTPMSGLALETWTRGEVAFAKAAQLRSEGVTESLALPQRLMNWANRLPWQPEREAQMLAKKSQKLKKRMG